MRIMTGVPACALPISALAGVDIDARVGQRIGVDRHRHAARLTEGADAADLVARDALGLRRRHHRRRLAAERRGEPLRSEEHTSELQSLMRISSAVFCLKKKTNVN